MITRKSQSVTQSNVYVDLADSRRINIADERLQIAYYMFSEANHHQSFEIDPRVGGFYIGQVDFKEYRTNV